MKRTNDLQVTIGLWCNLAFDLRVRHTPYHLFLCVMTLRMV